MNMRNTFTPLILLALSVFVACGPTKDLQMAKQAYNNAEFTEAAELYKSALSKKVPKDQKPDIYFNVAECYRRNHDYKNAEVLQNLSSDHFVFNPYNNYLLHIQMELCSKTLLDIMNQINEELNQKQNEVMSPTGYYISSELAIEIIESVDYLHKQNLIHRNLKPTNILITNGLNGRFTKLADLGLAVIHEMISQSHTRFVETCHYIAPEVLKTNKYDTKTDVYTLGIIIQELFNIDINK